MQEKYDNPTVAVKEIIAGINKHYKSKIGCVILDRPNTSQLDYSQNLEEIVDLLDSVNYNKICRLGYRSTEIRNDPPEQQNKFYKYLNENFYIIGCYRKNLFEYALSSAISSHSAVYNTSSIKEKLNKISSLIDSKLVIDKTELIKYLIQYKNYIEWSEENFQIQSRFYYEDSINHIEDYILNLDIMKDCDSWEDMFGQSWDDWYLCHQLLSKTIVNGTNQLSIDDQLLDFKWNEFKGADWPDLADVTTEKFNSLPTNIQEEIASKFDLSFCKDKIQLSLNDQTLSFLHRHLDTYKKINFQILDLVKKGYLFDAISIKLTSLAEKKSLIKNFNEALGWYNEWAIQNNVDVYSDDQLTQILKDEDNKLNDLLVKSVTITPLL
jgi:hypothetical protein